MVLSEAMRSGTRQAALHTPSCGHALVKSALRVWRGRRTGGNAGEFGRRAPRHIFEMPPQRLVMERARFDLAKIFAFSSARSAATYFSDLLIVAAIYIGFAESARLLPAIGLAATPLWPPTGFALALVLLRGY